ncbi:ATP-binding protein [Pseudonocardia parietis]|uniref:Orc1-like AAA ATPase domain-containing protein n=1 Tax=Pseudonocardia parietis TaxID=570936 RepID=A0ABS4VWZ5_9PSEU|nr:ATP-binding protein [Pseudonocardia parietis]MBP2368430.1 hypothetical protein [Pseudonocardia parietis]
MAGEPGSGGTLGELLASGRGRRFVGRAAEIELFRSAVETDELAFSVLHLHGPGGIGKTSLLEVFAAMATDAGALVVRIDGRDMEPTPAAVLDALGTDLDVPARGGAITGPSRIVLLIDAYELLAPLDDWLRTSLLPRFPAEALTVIAGRRPPEPGWRADAAWRDLLRVVSLRNWSPQESRRYLAACEIGADRHERLVAGTHGHPLALSLLADVVARGGEAAVDPLAPDVVQILVRRLIDLVPDATHRRALEVCAVARVTSELLLRDVLAVADAHELFGRLRESSFIESGPDGLTPHDLARDVLESDLRWRDPEGYRRILRAVQADIGHRLQATEGRDQQRALVDEKYLFERFLLRRGAGLAAPVDWGSLGRRYPEPARPADREPILELVGAWEGAESAAVAERWLDRQPEGFFVVRGPDGAVDGVLGFLDLDRACAQDVAADPGARAAWEFAHRHAPPRPGEAIRQTRFVVDRVAYQAPSATMNAGPVLSLQRHLRTPNLSWNFLTLSEPERWEAYFAVVDAPRAADFTVGGRRYGLFAHDYRQVPVDSWLDRLIEQALSDGVAPPAPNEPPLLVLAQEQFDDAVRQGLRDLHRTERLARNPLLRTRVLRDRVLRDRARDDGPPVTALHDLLTEAVATLGTHPRDGKLLRALDRTYLRPAATQERAAEVLGLPFSTYRRHLSQGIGRVVAWLWEREVYGPK